MMNWLRFVISNLCTLCKAILVVCLICFSLLIAFSIWLLVADKLLAALAMLGVALGYGGLLCWIANDQAKYHAGTKE